MALSKKREEKKGSGLAEFNAVKVTRCHDFGKGRIGFSADFGIHAESSTVTNYFVSVYNLIWVEGEKNGREYKFVSMPQRKGTDGNYYNECRVDISDSLLEDIENQLAKMLDE